MRRLLIQCHIMLNPKYTSAFYTYARVCVQWHKFWLQHSSFTLYKCSPFFFFFALITLPLGGNTGLGLFHNQKRNGGDRTRTRIMKTNCWRRQKQYSPILISTCVRGLKDTSNSSADTGQGSMFLILPHAVTLSVSSLTYV